jgi:hypothetical protein
LGNLPPYDPNLKPPAPKLDPTGRQEPEPEYRYVTMSEAHEDDRMTALDKLSVVAAIGCAQLVRLLIVFGAIGIIILVIWIGSHV